MSAPQFGLSTSGSNPKFTSRNTLEMAVQAVVDRLQDSIDATALAGGIGSGTVYTSAADGLAATSSGEVFLATVSNQLIAYLNNAGSETELAKFPTQTSVDTARKAIARRFGAVSAALGDANLTTEAGSIYSVSDGDLVEAERLLLEVATSGSQFSTVGGVGLRGDRDEAEIPISATAQITRPVADLSGAIFKQADGANLDTVATVSLSNSVTARTGLISLHVDGNKANNTTTVTGIRVPLFKKDQGRVQLAATDCDVGINITDNVEYLLGSLHVDGCGTGVLIDTDDATTPDELVIDVMAHDCDTFFEASGTNKSTGSVTFGCEVATSYGAKFNVGWWDIRGVLRGVGSEGAGGMLIDGGQVRGVIEIVGGSATNCEWALRAASGQLDALTVKLNGSYADGALIEGGVDGSALIITESSPNNTTAVQLGASTTYLDGFDVLPGTILSSADTALDLAFCRNCSIHLTRCIGDIVISASSNGNTISVSRRDAEDVTITNNRSQEDNVIIFRGAFTEAELNALNGSSPFKGMKVEWCRSYNAPAYFNGEQWVPSNGFLQSGEITVPNGQTIASVSHSLGYDPGDGALTVYMRRGSGWRDSAATKCEALVNDTDVSIQLDQDPGQDVTFQYQLRSIG